MDQGPFVLHAATVTVYQSAAVHSNGPGLPLPGPDVEVDLPESPRNAVYR